MSKLTVGQLNAEIELVKLEIAMEHRIEEVERLNIRLDRLKTIKKVFGR